MHYIVGMSSNRPESAPRISREESIGWMIKVISFWIDEQLKTSLKSIDISGAQFGILIALIEEDGLTQAEIGRRISMPGYATSRNIDDLERRNLLERQPHESSRRSHRIFISEQGSELAPSLYKVIDYIRSQLHEALDEKEIQTLRQLLLKIVRSIS